MEDVLVVGGLVDKISITLGIYGEGLNPDEVSRILKCQPTKAHRCGEHPHSNPRYSAYKKGSWLLNLKGFAPTTADELIDDIMSQVSTDVQIWQELSLTHEIRVRISVHMNGWNKGFDLSLRTIQRISDLKASIVFDIYAYDEDSL
jgi:hypothetical protein